MPGLKEWVHKGYEFNQTEVLKKLGQGSLGGACLSLVMKWASIAGETRKPFEAMRMFDNTKFISDVVNIHAAYHADQYGDKKDPLGLDQSPVTFDSLFKAIRGTSKGKLVLVGEYQPGERVSIRLSLFSKILPKRPRVFVVVFNCAGGRNGGVGAHAVGMYWEAGVGGVFDPNFGWISFPGGMTAIDLSVVLNELDAEYGMTSAAAYQYY